MIDYTAFAAWLDAALGVESLPEEIVAFNFNLYESAEDAEPPLFDVQLIGAPSYDPDDSDWACEEIFSTGENLFTGAAEDWETFLADVIKLAEEYLSCGQYADFLRSKQALTAGFVDGDLEVVFEQ